MSKIFDDLIKAGAKDAFGYPFSTWIAVLKKPSGEKLDFHIGYAQDKKQAMTSAACVHHGCKVVDAYKADTQQLELF